MILRPASLIVVSAAALIGAPCLAGAVWNQQQPPAKPAAQAPLKVIVSIPPLKGLVEALLPPGTAVEVLIPPGASEHGFEIPPSKLAGLKSADLVVLVGLGLEPQVEKFLAANAGPSRTVVRLQTLAGIETPKDEHEGHDHSGHDHAHNHDGPDPHLWLDPHAVIKALPELAKAVKTGLSPAAAKETDARADVLLARLGALDTAYAESIKGAKRKRVVVGHDAFTWLAKRYGFETVAIAGLCASEPTPGSIAMAVKTVKEDGLPCVFSEPQLSSAAVKRVADKAGVSVRTLDPLGDGDYFKLMESNLDALLYALGGTRAKAAGPAAVPGAAGEPALKK